MALLPDQLRDPWKGGPYPLAININAKILGLIVAILGGLGVVFGLIGFLGLLALGAFAATYGAHGYVALAIVGALIGVAASLAALIGGYQMYQLKESGKDLVLLSLLINAVGQLVTGFGYTNIVTAIVWVVVLGIVYYIVVISRFPGQSPLAASGAPPPPPSYEPPPPPPPSYEPPPSEPPASSSV